ncbi:MAG TPA: 3-deoxy-manno-octulosonate cytidylyltransferase [Candidatus Hydrogenedentes bacterium]|nr:3-deoxy-manno-octulosonate cytidylyltransferase [Candidatus Hydrogenedentota bacterium]HOL77419.1 3-deoxy-manno-octulosonate cytidylyltransferase [Candidatus Hydrogenedentota bacterium]HPO84562.1 3-deoxy-manno-octulosonate cytidylyltransferase [Candidatus Hydrogenedentota bacterium]
MTDESVVGVIPCRYGSTRLPGKPLKLIQGKPMIQWVYERACQVNVMQEVYVATDDPRIVEVCRKFGARAIMTSPNHRSGTDRIAEAIRHIPADIIVNIQGDQPFFDPVMVEEAVRPLLEDPSLKMTTLMHPITHPESLHDPSVVKVVTDLKGNALYFSRSLIPFPRESVVHQVYEHVGLYVYRREFLLALTQLPQSVLEQVESLEQLRVLEYGFPLRVVQTKTLDHEFSGFSVDTQQDLERAEQMLTERGIKS